MHKMKTPLPDPTRDELLAVINAFPYRNECDDFDVEGAIYWFACHWHGGQESDLYSVLSTSEFSPGPCCNGPEDESMEQDLYDLLERHFFPLQLKANGERFFGQ